MKLLDLIEVAVDPRQSGGQGPFTYLNPGGAVPGDIVAAPLAGRMLFGVVIAGRQIPEEELEFDASKLRTVSPPIQGLRLPEHALPMAAFIASQTLTSLSHALSLFIPPGVKDRLVTTWELLPSAEEEAQTPLQQEVVRTIREFGGTLASTKAKPLSAAMQRALRLLARRGAAREVPAVVLPQERGTLPSALRLTADAAAVEEFLHLEGRKKPAQALVLMSMQDAGGSALSPTEIRALAGVSDSTIKSLLTSGLLEAEERAPEGLVRAPEPNPAQQVAIDALQTAIEAREAVDFLLYGITGSGKTEVYMRAARQALNSGRQILYLVPEIALTAQVIGQLRARFGTRVAVLHSNLTPGERLKSWLTLAAGETPVVLGPRSALFAPLRDVGLIVMDEEHEASYKQETAPRYHSKMVARFLSEWFKCPLVLGSATPSVETFWEAETRKVRRLDLPQRAASAKLPSVHVADLKEGYGTGQPSLFTPALRERMADRLEKGEQTVLFLNRRAYAPYLGCRDCGYACGCPNCAVTLSYHKHQHELRCHFCDHRQKAPSECPSCLGTRIRPVGAGTQKVEEEVLALWPNARVQRLDRDVTAKKGALEAILAAMRAGEVDVLVGTQMVAKGLDFPGVTLVGVISADVALHLPDFRAGERAFQLLTQVAGRSGRGEKPGEVVIQTFSPEHPAVLYAQNHHYQQLYDATISEREMVGYPPFNRLVNILITGESSEEVRNVSGHLAVQIQARAPGAAVLGPVDCAIERLANQWRRHLLVKLLASDPLEPIGDAVASVPAGRTTVVIDVDPQNML